MSDESKSVLVKKRQLLTKREERLLAEIESGSAELNDTANKVLKSALIVGGSLMAVYLLYRVLSSDEGNLKKKKKVKMAESTGEARWLKPLVTGLLSKGAAILFEQVKKQLLK